MKFWIIAKPEALLFCRKDLEGSLQSAGFRLCAVSPIADWDGLSIELYADSTKVSPRQMQLQNIGRDQLLGAAGKYAELWELEAGLPLEDGYEALSRLKYAFRAEKWHPGLNIYFSVDGESALYHYSYFHVPDPSAPVIQEEMALIGRYLS